MVRFLFRLVFLLFMYVSILGRSFMFVSVVVRDLFSLVSWLIIFVIMIIFVYISVVCVVRFL